MNAKFKIVTLIVTIVFLLTGCSKEPEQISFEGKTMGTTYHIKYIDNQNKELPSPSEVKDDIDNLLIDVNNSMSTYQRDSEISRFNQSKEVNKPFTISEDFATVFKTAVHLNKVTEGALDITVGPLVNLWGFGPDKKVNREPTQDQIAEKIKAVGIEKVKLVSKDNEPALLKKNPNVYIDLSSIAKGFGVDKLANYLEKLGVKNYLVEIGGELKAKGENIQEEPWKIAIEKPEFEQAASVQIIIPLHDLGMATSGNYRNYFEDKNGKRLSHIIDPKKLKPISHNLASVTVLADTTMKADGLATGLFVLGSDKALEIAEKEKLPVFLIIKEKGGYKTKMSSAFKKLTNL
ncbi:Thiamine biosynthesis lipoprotein ApbE precursor [Phocoenobacter uteri]|uniref:FAD:protein FMN transferase n=1 Tax=Phocoenobacter uteri TaxID=146806 RepID=A0A379C939_9PAST|nr:FAD:protein FMN transferase [Phocoenobacter uteri]MDG6882067.1 thiamine biosynthesis protein ApbE [Phocoenobacter uteri]SUB58216.1 Thiamine biosynthesis lipoprotein ApbE precursor [Phocoenobacter uteri]